MVNTALSWGPETEFYKRGMAEWCLASFSIVARPFCILKHCMLHIKRKSMCRHVHCLSFCLYISTMLLLSAILSLSSRIFCDGIMFYICIIFFFFNFFFYWGIIALQNFVVFHQTSKSIRHRSGYDWWLLNTWNKPSTNEGKRFKFY